MKSAVRNVLGVLALSLLAGNAGAQLLYANGTPAPLLSTGTLSDSGVTSPAATTWSECQHPTADLTIANTSAGFGANVGANRLADDFTVPPGGWVINTVDLYGYRTGAPATPSPFTAYTLQIWGPCTAGTRPGDTGCTTIVFGDTTTNRLASSTDATLFRVFNTVVAPATAPGTTRKIWRNRLTVGAALGPGLFWLDWDSTAGGTHFDPALTPPGARATAGANARQFTVVGATWADVVDAGQGPAAPINAILDMPFELNGVVAPVELMNFDVR